MDKEEIHLNDVTRILLGEAPPDFLLEVLLRTIIIYLFFMVIVRFLGKRMAGQLTITELGVMLTLGAIIAPAMQAPEIGILIGIFVLASVYVFQRGLTYINFKSKRAEKLTQGKVRLLVEDGVLNLKEMRRARISRNQVFSKLRNEGIFNLGAVERMYFEACGQFSIFKAAHVKPGLTIFPPGDTGLSKEMKLVNNEVQVCTNCGNTKNNKGKDGCLKCNHNEWGAAINYKN